MEKIWKKRGEYQTIEEIMEHSSGQSIEQILHPERNPYLPGLDDVCNTIWMFLNEHPNAPITLIGDYDEDGMASCEIMGMVLYRLTGKQVDFIIPDRVKDGYGFNESFISRIDMKDGKGLLITVDNGIAAIEEIRKAHAKGLTVVVIDHHQPLESGELPYADALMDPHTVKGDHFKDYCAAGLCLRVANQLLRMAHIYDDILLKQLTAFAAVATITDVVPLIGDNRNIVKDGLQIMKNRECTAAFNMLLDLLNLNSPTEEDLGFTLGPVFNAVGRMPEGDTELMVAAMMEDQESESLRRLLTDFIALNEARKKLVTEASNQVIVPEGEFPVISYIPDMPLGIVGILAGRLAESHGTAAFVLADDETDGIIKGSARAGESGVHLKNMLDACSDLLTSHGGHEKAAGLSLRRENLEAFRSRCKQYMHDKGCVPSEDRPVYYDLEIDACDIAQVNTRLQEFAPFGERVPKPVFRINGFRCIPGNNGQPYRDSQKSEEWISFNGTYANASSFHGIKQRWIEDGCPLEMSMLGTLGVNEYKNILRNEIRLIDYKPEKKAIVIPDQAGKEGDIMEERNMQPAAPAQNPQEQTQAKPVNYGKAFQDIPVGGKEVLIACLMGVEESVTSQGSAYCKLTMSDHMRDIQTANIWDVSRETLEKMGVVPGNLYVFALSCKNYQDSRSYTVQGKTREKDIMAPPQGAKIEDFIPSAPYEAQELYDLILKYVEAFCKDPVKELVGKIYDDHKNQLLYWGAARSNHHSYRSGLLWHQAAMVEEAYGLMMGKRFDSLNKSVVIAACALHDIGKLYELQTDPLGVSEYTESGNLFGHLLIGYDMIRDYAKLQNVLDNEEVKHLLHIIISHHGNQEWGAIKQPLTREANLVHHVDLLDSSDEEFCEEYAKLAPGEMMQSVSKVLRRPVVKPVFSV